jgi:hypothetical protein
MKTTPAHRGAGTDESTGRELWQIRPVDTLTGVSSSASFSNAEPNQLYSRREISRSSSRTTSPSCLSTEIASTSWSSSWPSTVIGSRGGAVAVRKRRRAPIAGATTGGSDPLRVDPTGRAAPDGPPTSSCGGGCGGRLRYRTLHYANARVRTPTDHGLSVSIPISGVSA